MGIWSQFLGASDPQAQDRYLDDWVKGIERGYLSATGARVTVQDALTVPGIAACLQVLADDLAKVPLELKKRVGDGFEPAVDHPLYAALKFGPAPWLSSYAWRRAMVHTAAAYGNAYCRIYRTERGGIDRMVNLPVGRTTPRWADDGEPFFDVMIGSGLERGLSWQDVLHVPYRGSTDHTVNGGIHGVSPINQNRETVALALATERFAARFFANGARPSIAIEMDKRLPNDDVATRLRASIERIYSGVDNAHKVAILELGMKIREFSSNPQDSQLIESRKESAIQACTMYRVPPHKIGILDRATFSNIENQEIGYVTGPVSAMAKCIESAIQTSCLTPDEREQYKVEHNLEGLMRGDILSRYRAYAIGRQWGWLSANAILNRENENGIGPDGDQYLVPLNMNPPVKNPPEGEDQQPPDQNPDQPTGGWKLGEPITFRSFDPKRLNGSRRLASITGPSGEPLYLH